MRIYELAKEKKVSSKVLLEIIKGLGIKGKVAASALSKESVEKISSHLKAKKRKKGPSFTSRAPIITLMGHVDHGKTSVLDVIRESRLTASEYGEITQHIGAYRTNVEGKEIVFLDTPGHEAFTAIRARGARITDLVVLVVAADDGVMPQTVEAIDHCKEAKVPVIVAINKIDKIGINVEAVKNELAKLGLTSEEWGGKTIFVETSAKTKTGIKKLLEVLSLEAEMLELKANPGKAGEGTVIETKMDRREGKAISIIVRDGTIKIGNNFIVGDAFGKVKALINEEGKNLREAGPSTPVKILGAESLPLPGDILRVVDPRAKEIDKKRKLPAQNDLRKPTAKITLEDFFSGVKKDTKNELKLILKGDVAGSVEAVAKSLEKLEAPEIEVNIIHRGIGGINESDVMLAAASNAIVIGFNIPVENRIKELAEKEEIDLRTYRLIYDLIDDVKKAMEGILEPKELEEDIGEAEIRRVFVLSNGNAVAGCIVSKGKVIRNAKTELIRGEKVIYQGKISGLRRFKENAKEVATNYECGIQLENFNDFKAGDHFRIYQIKKVPQKL